MRTMLPIFACGVGLLVCGAALADDTQKPNAMPATYSTIPASNDSHAVICRHAVHEGMLTQQVVCATQRQWDVARHETQQDVSDMQMRGLMSDLH